MIDEMMDVIHEPNIEEQWEKEKAALQAELSRLDAEIAETMRRLEAFKP